MTIFHSTWLLPGLQLTQLASFCYVLWLMFESVRPQWTVASTSWRTALTETIVTTVPDSADEFMTERDPCDKLCHGCKFFNGGQCSKGIESIAPFWDHPTCYRIGAN